MRLLGHASTLHCNLLHLGQNCLNEQQSEWGWVYLEVAASVVALPPAAVVPTP